MVLRDPLILAALGLAILACDRQDASSDQPELTITDAPAPAASQRGVDSATAVRLLTDAILAHAPDQRSSGFRVASFSVDSAGYQITLIPDRVNLVGGGGEARITRSGEVRDLVLHQ